MGQNDPFRRSSVKEVENKYIGWKHIYTNGSKREMGVKAAATTENRSESASLPNSALYSQQKHSQ